VRPYAPVLLVLTIPLLLIVMVQQDQRRNEHRLAAIASEIAGRTVDVNCPGLLARIADASAHAGTVFFDERGRPADFTDLDDQTCSELDRFAEGKTDSGEDDKVARALHVLAHESSHLAGIRDEAAADCYGLQRTAFVAESLGADPEKAAARPPRARRAGDHRASRLPLVGMSRRRDARPRPSVAGLALAGPPTSGRMGTRSCATPELHARSS
jgi:hypothetical protein